MRDREAAGRKKICTSFGHMWSAGFHTNKIRARIRCLQCMFQLDCVSSRFRMNSLIGRAKRALAVFPVGEPDQTILPTINSFSVSTVVSHYGLTHFHCQFNRSFSPAYLHIN